MNQDVKDNKDSLQEVGHRDTRAAMTRCAAVDMFSPVCNMVRYATGRYEAIHVIFCFAPMDSDRAVSMAESLEQLGFQCRLPDGYLEGRSYSPEDFQWADAVVVLMSEAANLSENVRRQVEEAVNSDLRLLPVRMDGSVPGRALRYYLGPYQWLEDAGGADFVRRLSAALHGEGVHTGEHGRQKKVSTLRRGGVLVSAVALTILAFTSLNGAGSADDTDQLSTVQLGSGDILLVGNDFTGTLPAFIMSLGYSVDSVETLPEQDELQQFDLVVLCLPVSPELDLPLYEFVAGGGSLLLTSGQPYFLGMPSWMGMETYSNYWGGDFPITATEDSAMGVSELRQGDVLIYYTSFVDGAAVLKGPTTAVVDACFNGEDSLAAAVRNTVGAGRMAWVFGNPEPYADIRGNMYSTDGFELYLAALYSWLDRDGPDVHGP